MFYRHGFRLLLLCLPLWWGLGAAAHQPPPTVPLRITEVYYDTPGTDDEEEWIEIANLGDEPIDLSDIKVGDAPGSGSNEGMMRFPEGATIAAEQVIIVAQTASGFRVLFGANPDYEMNPTDDTVPDMRRYRLWATGAVGLGNDGDEIVLLNKANGVIDGVNYGDKTTLFEPAVLGVFTGQSIERVPATCDTDAAADWQPQERPTPGTLQFEGECTSPAELMDLLPIGQIQGSGPVAARVNETVSLRGVVTGIGSDRNTEGFTYYTLFVQDVPGAEDGDPTTSDGIALFLGSEQPHYAVGDHLLVTGRVTEFFGFTEMEDDGLEIIVESQGNPLPTPIELNPPPENEAAAAYLEPFEGMRVSLPESLVVGPTISTCSFAVVRADSGVTRVIRHQESDPIGQVIPILHTNDTNCTGFPQVKTGDQVMGLVGPLTYHFDQFKIIPQDLAALTIHSAPAQPAPVAPPLQPDQISIASFNLENHFDTMDDTGTSAEPKPLPIEIQLKQTKLAYTLGVTLGCPTLVGIQEVEKESLLLDLADAAAARCGFTYVVSHLESADVRGIDVALLSHPELVDVQTVQLRQTCSTLRTGIVDPSVTCVVGEEPLFSRPPLQVDLLVNGQSLTVLVNHFKSKRGGETETEGERLTQAAYINQLVQELSAAGQDNLIILGDFNDYFNSPPLQKLGADGLQNALALIPAEARYSFVFSGASQLIDAIFLSPPLAERLVTPLILHVNADFPDILGGDLSPEHIAHKTTDHDLPLVILDWTGVEIEVAAASPPATTLTVETGKEGEERDAAALPTVWLGASIALVTLGAGLLFILRRRITT